MDTLEEKRVILDAAINALRELSGMGDNTNTCDIRASGGITASKAETHGVSGSRQFVVVCAPYIEYRNQKGAQK